MRQSPKTDPAPKSPKGEYTALSMILDMADTTWRMFIPIVGLLLIGRYADSQMGTKPFAMLMGALIGTAIAWKLIQRQLKRNS